MNFQKNLNLPEGAAKKPPKIRNGFEIWVAKGTVKVAKGTVEVAKGTVKWRRGP